MPETKTAFDVQPGFRNMRSYVDLTHHGQVVASLDMSTIVEQLAARIFPEQFGRRLR